MPPRKNASPTKSPAKPAKSPKAVASTPPRSSSRARKAPGRLGLDDSWGTGAAGSWVSPEAKMPVKKMDMDAAAADTPKKPSAISMADFLVFGVGVAAWYYALTLFNLPLMGRAYSPEFYALIAIIGSLHIFYAIVWTNPKAFIKSSKKGMLGKVFGKVPVKAFGTMAKLGKAIQVVATIVWALYVVQGISSLDGVMDALTKISPDVGLCAAGLILIGQILNLSFYKAIGQNGVYYGYKLGAAVPWSSDFPFSAGFRHPQCVAHRTRARGS